MYACMDVKKWILWVLIVVKRLLLWFWKSFLMLDILSWQLELSDLLADVERVTSSTETIRTVFQRFGPLFEIVIHLYPSWHKFTACNSVCFFSGIDCLSLLVLCYDSRDYTSSDQALSLFFSSDRNIFFCLTVYIFTANSVSFMCFSSLRKIIKELY